MSGRSQLQNGHVYVNARSRALTYTWSKFVLGRGLVVWHRADMQPVTFRVNEHVVTVSAEDAAVLLRMLRRLAESTPGFDFAGPIAKIDDQRQVPARSAGGGVSLEPGEDTSVLRALQHLRFHPGLSRPLVRLWDALLAQTDAESHDYVLDVDTAKGKVEQTFTSYGGPYRVGEELPPDEQGKRWQIVHADGPDELGRLRFFCLPA
jgi:hypothetical protein